ncbi:molecular chaperone GrpE [Zymomonas mobilis]|uniref:nucleotide exchange factor GrpE n=1 Tax=Zymomonas mobilis TaxID=542 RepID=UPI00026D82B9|nr:nucleotide exchange factor GrpE [Zymomonas mobilis]AFN57057.1 Protein grpE [Zymomonas mobilis subsp. mobilis ATCC 29191]TQK77504.1 molecular chaperone GrpE [Zymomonas mobilis]TQL15841.1 molecular chaperone GrpE [Zymomonas mobilis]GEB88212.1 protein GrpE [Zymomonas mobilis subsp. mobilis]
MTEEQKKYEDAENLENKIENPEDASDEKTENGVEALQAENGKLKEQLLYIQAEAQNTRRRLEKEKSEAITYSVTGFARDMLAVADNMERALAAIPDDIKQDKKIKNLVTGIEMTGKELLNILQRHGIKRVESVGQKLDPNLHQAMIEMESDKPEGTVVQEMQAGYTIHDRLLRPAMVGVAKAQSGETKSA